ncbi:signal peptidase I, partial [Streptomyces sp. NPDC001274]
MSDVAAGARSGHGEPAERPGPPADAVPGPPEQAADPAAPGAERPEDGDPDGEGTGKPQRPFWKELPLLIVVALVLALLIKTFLVQAFSIPSDSMQ